MAKCPCGEKAPFSRRAALKQALQLNAALVQAAEYEDLMNDMSGSRGTSMAMARNMGTDIYSEQEVEKAILAERSDTWKRAHEVLQQLHEVAHGREGTVPSDHELMKLRINLMTGPHGPQVL
jgi:hypothetical protein